MHWRKYKSQNGLHISSEHMLIYLCGSPLILLPRVASRVIKSQSEANDINKVKA